MKLLMVKQTLTANVFCPPYQTRLKQKPSPHLSNLQATKDRNKTCSTQPPVCTVGTIKPLHAIVRSHTLAGIDGRGSTDACAASLAAEAVAGLFCWTHVRRPMDEEQVGRDALPPATDARRCETMHAPMTAQS
jgi:hypothetical protein